MSFYDNTTIEQLVHRTIYQYLIDIWEHYGAKIRKKAKNTISEQYTSYKDDLIFDIINDRNENRHHHIVRRNPKPSPPHKEREVRKKARIAASNRGVSMQRRQQYQNEWQDEQNDNIVYVDGKRWDLSSLERALPDQDDEGARQPVMKGKKKEQWKEEGEFRLEAVPKYDWRKQKEDDDQQHVEPLLVVARQDIHVPPPIHQHQREQSIQLIQTETEYEEERKRPLIEVFPGIEMPLRGSAETQNAINRGSISKASCLDCTLEISCIEDAEYMLCPLCHCVTPLALTGSDVFDQSFGVGLGFVDD